MELNNNKKVISNFDINNVSKLDTNYKNNKLQYSLQKNPTRTKFKNNINIDHKCTPSNCYQKNITYNTDKYVEYIVNNENIICYKDIIISFTELENNDNNNIIEVFFNNILLLSCTLNEILEILKCNFNQKYNNIMKIYNSTKKLIIPIQYILFGDQYIFLTNKILKIVQKSNNNIYYPSLSYNYYILTEDENRRYTYTGNEYIFNNYYIHTIDYLKNKDYIFKFDEFQIPINNIIIISDNYISNVKIIDNNSEYIINDFNNLSLLNSYCNDTIINNEKTSNKLYSIIYDNNFYNIGDKFIPNENKKIVINSLFDCKIKIIFSFYNFLQISVKDINITYSIKKKYPNYNNFYPLTKLEDNKFIESYWWSEKDDKYPFPKESDNKVDLIFIDKLKVIMKNSKKKDYLGSSYCRICDISNSCSEYILENNNITFVVPDGVLHYYEVHNVHPSNEFFNFVMNYKI